MKKPQLDRFGRASAGIGFLLVLGIVVAINAIVAGFNMRWDVTEEGLYTLSEGTARILGKLEKPVTLKLYYNRSSEAIPTHVRSLAREIEDLLDEYVLLGNGRVKLEHHDPKPDSEAEEWAHRYGVQPQNIQVMGPPLYLGLAVVAGDRDETIPTLNRSGDLLEYEITRRIARIAGPPVPTVGVMSTLPVLGRQMGLLNLPGQPVQRAIPAWAMFAELRDNYEVLNIPIDAEEIRENIDILVVVHPKELSDKTLYAIDQHVLRGGSLLVFVDPYSMVDTPDGSPQFHVSNRSSDLPALFQAWGIGFDPQRVAADLEAQTNVRMSRDDTGPSPVWLSLRRDSNFNLSDSLMSQVDLLRLPYVGALTLDPPEGIEATPLLWTSGNSGFVPAMQSTRSLSFIRNTYEAVQGRLILAARLRGKFKTAFPDGPPLDDDGSDDSTDNPGHTSAVEESVVLVFADSDVLYDMFCLQPQNVMGFQVLAPENDNLRFFANSVDQIAGGADLTAVRSKKRKDRTFDKFIELESQAQQELVEKERELMERAAHTQKRIEALQAARPEGQSLSLSPEQQREIRMLRQEALQTNKELRLVRRNLREDIERLGIQIKVLNIAGMPILLSLIGLVFGGYRRARQRKRSAEDEA